MNEITNKAMNQSASESRNRNKTRRRAQAVVEFALVVPILLTLTMGLIQYGIIANAESTLTNLGREGARYAAVHGTETSTNFNGTTLTTSAAIRSYIRQVATPTSIRTTDLPDSAIIISPADGNSARVSGNSITITINYDLRKKFFMPTSFPGLSKFGTNYATTSIMIIE